MLYCMPQCFHGNNVPRPHIHVKYGNQHLNPELVNSNTRDTVHTFVFGISNDQLHYRNCDAEKSVTDL